MVAPNVRMTLASSPITLARPSPGGCEPGRDCDLPNTCVFEKEGSATDDPRQCHARHNEVARPYLSRVLVTHPFPVWGEKSYSVSITAIGSEFTADKAGT